MSKRIDQFKTAGEPWLPDNEGGIGRVLALTDLTFAGDPTPGAQLGTIVKTPFGEMPLNASMLQDGFIPAARYQDATIPIEKLVFPGGATSFLNADGDFTAISVTGMVDPMEEIGDMIIRNAVNVTARLPAGVEGQVVKMVGGLPAWATDSTAGTAGFGIDITGAVIESDITEMATLHVADTTEVLVQEYVTGTHGFSGGATMLKLADGTFLIIYEGRPDNIDFTGARLYKAIWDGKTITQEGLLFAPGTTTQTEEAAASLFRMGDGNIGLIFAGFEDESDNPFYLSISTDEGETWGAPDVIQTNAVFALLNHDRVVTTADGTKYLPFANHTGGPLALSDPASVYQGRFMKSTDGGATWTLHEMTIDSPDNLCAEPGIYESEVTPSDALGASTPKLVYYWRSRTAQKVYYVETTDDFDTISDVFALGFDAPNAPNAIRSYNKRVYAAANKYLTNASTQNTIRKEMALYGSSVGELSFNQIARVAGNDDVDKAYTAPSIYRDPDSGNLLVLYSDLDNITGFGELFLKTYNSAIVESLNQEFTPGASTWDVYGGNSPLTGSQRGLLRIYNRTAGVSAGHIWMGNGLSNTLDFYPYIKTFPSAGAGVVGAQWDAHIDEDYANAFSAGLVLNVLSLSGGTVDGPDCFAIMNNSALRLRLTYAGNLVQPASAYHNFGSAAGTSGSTGYGFRDNGGVMEFKDSGGSWAAFGTGGGGGNPFADNTDLVKNAADNTKLLRLSAASITTATTRTLTAQDANYIIAGTNIQNTFSENQIISKSGAAFLRISSTSVVNADMDIEMGATGNVQFKSYYPTTSYKWSNTTGDVAELTPEGRLILGTATDNGFALQAPGSGQFAGSGSAVFFRVSNSDFVNADIEFRILDTGEARLISYANAALSIYTAAAEKMVISAGGDVKQNASTYHNWGATFGTSGYGFRDNAGTMEYKNSGGAWAAFSAGGGVTTMAAFGSTPNDNGASISGSTLTLQPADATHGGGVSITTQTFAGAKTFTGNATFSGTGAAIISVSGTSGIVAAGSSFGGEFTSNAGTPLLVSNNGTGAGVVNAIIMQRNGSYTGAANDGLEIRFAGKSSADTNRNFAMINAIFSDATNAAETGAMTFHFMLAGASMVEKFRMHGNGMFEGTSLKTGAPSGSTAQPTKFGAQTTGSTGITVDSTKYYTIDSNGTVIHLCVAVLP